MRPNGVSNGLKAEIAGREVVLLVVERIVGDVHLAIEAGDGALGIQRDGGVVVEARRAPLEQRSDDGDLRLARHLGQPGRRGTGNGLGQIEQAQVFALAEILRAEKLRQADDLRAAAGGVADMVQRRVELASGSGPMLICTRPLVFAFAVMFVALPAIPANGIGLACLLMR